MNIFDIIISKENRCVMEIIHFLKFSSLVFIAQPDAKSTNI